MKNSTILIGYSGHAYVLIDILQAAGREVIAYCDREKKEENPHSLKYIGSESAPSALEVLEQTDYCIGIGSNVIREKVQSELLRKGMAPAINGIHPSAVISGMSEIGYGVMIAANVSINPLVNIGNGIICNTGCIIEHECQIGNYAHIAPGAVLAGNVRVGQRSFVGANAAVKQGITIGADVIIGAGAVIINDVPDGAMVVGNPGKIIRQKT